MINVKNHGFELPMPKGLKASSVLDLDSIEQWMSDAESSSGAIGREVAAFARLAQLLLNTGLNQNAVALLIQGPAAEDPTWESDSHHHDDSPGSRRGGAT